MTRTLPAAPSRRRALAILASCAALPGAALAGELAQAAPDDVAAALVEPPRLPDVWLGDASARVTVIEYASMTCSHCAAFHARTLPDLRRRYVETGKVRYALREFPLDPLAVAAAMLARCRGPELFHETVSALFADQANWAFTAKPYDAVREAAARAGIDGGRFEACLKDQALYEGVMGSRGTAERRLSVSSTPTFFVNGRRQVGAVAPESLDGILSPHLE